MKRDENRYIWKMGVSSDPFIWRPPVEAQSLILQLTIGCPWNRCLFCGTYKKKRFKVRKMSDFIKDVSIAKKHFGDKPEYIFLMDANSIALRTDRLLEVCRLLYDAFPKLKGISLYGSARFINRKKDEDLEKLGMAGLTKIYMGLETGDDSLLNSIDKGATSKQMIMAAEKIKAAGIELSVTIIAGLGGKGSSKENAEKTAEVLSKMKPKEVRIHNLVLNPDSPLYKKMKKGEFVESSWDEVIKEMRELIRRLDADVTIYTHPTTYLNPALLYGCKLPEDRELILEILTSALSSPESYIQRDRDF
jgi:radical SAM superfamily enzyme YgiQ (UPF0313 family)